MVRFWLVAGLLVVGCKRHEPPAPSSEPREPAKAPTVGSPVARGTLKRTWVETAYGVAVAAGADLAALEKLAHEKGKDLEIIRASLDDLFDDGQLAFVTRELPQAEVDGLRSSPGVILLRGSGPDGLKLAREVAGATREVADAAHGWVLDPETFAIYPASAFRDHVPGDRPDVRKLIVVHSIAGGNEQPFLDTAGLHRYGLPELYFAEAATGHINQLTMLMNGAAQTLLDGGDVNARGEITIDFHALGWDVGIIEAGSGRAVVKTRWARERDAPDDGELVVELVPPSAEGAEGAASLISDCFGSEPEHLAMTDKNDPELIAAAAKARVDLDRLRAHFAGGIPVGERLSIKAQFSEARGQVEWMWVDVVAFKRDVFEGTLANEPELIESLRLGQKVKVKLAEVGDYLFEKAGEAPKGGYSIEVFKNRGLYSPGAH